MPLQNGRGDVLMGSGGSQGSVNGQVYPFASDGRGCWLDDDTILLQLSAGNVLATWRFRDGVAPVVLEPRRGANAMAGGGGHWLADVNGYVYGSIPDIPGAALIGVAPDGTLAYYPNAQSGIGLVIINPNGQALYYPAVVAKPAPQVVGAGVVIWERGAVGRPPLRPAMADAQGWQLVTVDGEDWIVYWSESVGLVAQRDGAKDGYLLGRGAWHYHARNVDGQLRIVWSVTDGEGPNDARAVVVDRTQPRVPLVPPPPPPPPPPVQPIGPRSSPLPQGQRIDLRRYLIGDAALWPRIGPTHSMGQIVRPDGPDRGLCYFIKFANNEPSLSKGQSHEAYAYDWLDSAFGFYQLYDASAGPTVAFSDPRQYPRRMQIGEAYAFDTGDHRLITRDRDDCRVLSDVGFRRRMWLHAAWSAYYWGPDLGERPTVMMVYDNTAGVYNTGRWLEVNYFALDAGWCLFEPHRSDLVFATGKAVFTEETRAGAPRSAFYLIGGPNPDPFLVPCMSQAIPDYPAWPPPPKPPVDPPQPPTTPYRHHKRMTKMPELLGTVRGPGGKLGRPDERNTGPWKDIGWRGLVFDGTSAQKGDERYHFVANTDKSALVSKKTGSVIGCDATPGVPALDKQFYIKPDGDTGQGWAEQWQFYDGNRNGAIMAVIEYSPGAGGDDGAFFSYALAFEAIK